MTRLEATHILGLIEDAFKRMHGCEDEAEALRMAIYDMGIVEDMKKQRDAMMEGKEHVTD